MRVGMDRGMIQIENNKAKTPKIIKKKEKNKTNLYDFNGAK